MPINAPIDGMDVTDPLGQKEGEWVIPLAVEEAIVSRRTVKTGVVRVERTTHIREHVIQEDVSRERVDIEHVPVGRYVETIPPVREEGDVTIVPVVDEVVVVERRLLLREEVHLRRVRTTEQHMETVALREQEATVTRTPAGQGRPVTQPNEESKS